MRVTSFTILLLCAVSVCGHRLPASKSSWLTPCYRDDPKFNECALRNGRLSIPAFVKGDAKYHIPVLDPLQIPEIRMDRNVTKLGLDIYMWNLTLIGLKDTILQDIDFDLESQTMKVTAFVPNLQILNTYNMSGNILMVPIVGTGPGNITVVNLTCVYTVSYDLVKNRKNHKEHMSVKNSNLTVATDRAYARLDNLFSDNELISENINLLFDLLWQDLVAEIAPAISQTISDVVTENMKSVTEVFSFDEMVPRRPKKNCRWHEFRKRMKLRKEIAENFGSDEAFDELEL